MDRHIYVLENSILMCEIHLAERYPYLLMWYTSRFVCKLCLFICTSSQSGDPFVLVLFKCFHNTFTRCPRFSALIV